MASPAAMREWCRAACARYPGVDIRDLSLSFRDGLAFCAIIHRHRPDLIDFRSLSKDNAYLNNKLAFEVAEAELGIPALLAPGDMVCTAPDYLGVITYLSWHYCVFNRKSYAGPAGRGSPSGSSQSAAHLRVSAGRSVAAAAAAGGAGGAGGDLTPPSGAPGTACPLCLRPVHLIQRRLAAGKVYHRACLRCAVCGSTLLPGCYTTQQGHDAPPGALVCAHHAALGVDCGQPESRGAPGGPTPCRVLEVSSLSGLVISSAPHYSRRGGVCGAAAAAREGGAMEVKSVKKAAPPPPPPPRPAPPPAPPVHLLDAPEQAAGEAAPGPAPFGIVTTGEAASGPAPFGIVTSGEAASGPAPFGIVTSGEAAPGPAPFGMVTPGEAAIGPAPLLLHTPEEAAPGPAPIGTETPGEAVPPPVPAPRRRSSCSVAPVPAPRTRTRPSPPQPACGAPAAGTEPPSLSSSPPVPSHIARQPSRYNANHPWMKIVSPGPWQHLPPAQAPLPAPRTWYRARVPPRNPFEATERTSAGDGSPVEPAQAAAAAAADSTGSDTGEFAAEGAAAAAAAAGPDVTPSEKQSGSLPRSLSVPALAPGKEDEQAARRPAKLKTACQVNPFDEKLSFPRSKTFQSFPSRRSPAPGHGFPLVRRKVQTDACISTESLQVEKRELDERLEEMERRGVELERNLRDCRDDGEREERLLLEWFGLHHARHRLVRRDAELSHLTMQQRLEERQADVEYELRRLLSKQECDWTQEDRDREQRLLSELVSVIDQRNLIVSSLDQDMQRERGEDKQFEAAIQNKDLQRERLKELRRCKGKFSASKVFKRLNHKAAGGAEPAGSKR